MNKDNVINVISVKQMGYLLLNDEEMDMSWEKPFSFVLQFRTLTFPDYVVLFEKRFYESRTCRRDDTCFRQWFN